MAENPSAGAPPLADLAGLMSTESAVMAIATGSSQVVAVPDAARALAIAAAANLSKKRPILVAVPTTAEAQSLAGDLKQYLCADEVEWFPSWETLPFERVSPTVDTMGRRLKTIWRLRQENGADGRLRQNSHDMPQVVVASVRALTQRLGPHIDDVEPLVIRAGDQIDREAVLTHLVTSGYRREYQVEARGEVAVRGSILDVFPSTADHPVRIDLWGDEVESVSTFSVADQRSTGILNEVALFPARELLASEEVRERARELIHAEPWGASNWERLAEGQVFDGMESWLPWLTNGEHLLADLLGSNALVVLIDPPRLRDRARDLAAEEVALAETLAETWGADPQREFPRLSLGYERLLATTKAPAITMVSVPPAPDTPHLIASRFDPVVGDGAMLASRINALIRDGYQVMLAANGVGSAQRLTQALADEGVPPSALRTVIAAVERGVIIHAAKIALVAEADLTGRRRMHRAAKPTRTLRGGADHYDDLHVGAYVVHAHHGVGRFAGMVTRDIGGVERDYLLLEYKGADKLYVPTDQVGVVRAYTGGESPNLHRMGGADFARAKSRVRESVRAVAEELVALYRQRLATPGFAFSPDTPWQRELEEAFEHEETPDQLRAIEETKADMELAIPMDRLICGDVGYGKTEVAIRAAFKAVQDGKQVAVLVPTTLLATQHGQTFAERFAGFPIRVEVISRFLTTKEQSVVMAGLAAGTVDVVIGTHRLLSKDVKFHDLGLLVVDEEQRFGVSHKEKIKAIRTAVDVLTLSATPIPRTLELSLTGIRELSLVHTPPEDRHPILTYVGPYEEAVVSEAIRRELLREGQVFFVHNRVADIELAAMRVRELVPAARVAIAHGQMDEGRLERVIQEFTDREFDVLVCTTIVESGLDMPTVNTMVVDRADRLGLSQLYQLRGRVGRRGQRAYAYLLHPSEATLTDEAYERLKTIGENTELGSGFKIAMRDLEIRGAGTLLGEAQSGQIASVGFDLYCQLVTEAVGELTGDVKPPQVEVAVDVPLDAFIPRDYIERDDVRMEAYRRLAAAQTSAGVADVRAEWTDRYGPPPPSVEALLLVGALRVECFRIGIDEVAIVRGVARLSPLVLKASQQARLSRLAGKAVVRATGEVTVPVPSAQASDPVGWLIGFLGELLPPDALVGLPGGQVPSAAS